jgi:hypothetical protein
LKTTSWLNKEDNVHEIDGSFDVVSTCTCPSVDILKKFVVPLIVHTRVGGSIVGGFVEGMIVDGEVVDGEVVDGEVVDGEVVDGEVVDGEVVDGEVVEGWFVEGTIQLKFNSIGLELSKSCKPIAKSVELSWILLLLQLSEVKIEPIIGTKRHSVNPLWICTLPSLQNGTDTPVWLRMNVDINPPVE